MLWLKLKGAPGDDAVHDFKSFIFKENIWIETQYSFSIILRDLNDDK